MDRRLRRSLATLFAGDLNNAWGLLRGLFILRDNHYLGIDGLSSTGSGYRHDGWGFGLCGCLAFEVRVLPGLFASCPTSSMLLIVSVLDSHIFSVGQVVDVLPFPLVINNQF